MWNFLYAIESPNVIEGIDAWGETTVKAEDLIIDQSGQGKVIEEIGEIFPNVGIAVFSETLVIETVHLGDLTRFMISSEDSDSARVSDFQSYKKGHSLNRVITSINVITYIERLESRSNSGRVSGVYGQEHTHEEVVGIWIWSTNSEQLHQVMKLTMNISADSDRTFLDVH